MKLGRNLHTVRADVLSLWRRGAENSLAFRCARTSDRFWGLQRFRLCPDVEPRSAWHCLAARRRTAFLSANKEMFWNTEDFILELRRFCFGTHTILLVAQELPHSKWCSYGSILRTGVLFVSHVSLRSFSLYRSSAAVC